MADVKRLNYFTSQFLVEKDFKDEQGYHLNMRRRHNQLLHTWGVADGGLLVTKSSDHIVGISSGMAIDKDGRDIVLLDAQSKDLTTFGSNADVYITLKYQEVSDPGDHYTAGGVDNYTRTTERPLVEAGTTIPVNDGSVIVLAKVKLDGSGNISMVDGTARKLAGSAIDPTVNLAAGSLSVTGNATVGGKVGIGTTNLPQQLSITGGIGFANQNAADKKLYSPADGVLEWMTHDAAGQHGLAVSHQGQQRVFFNSNGNSYLNGGNVGIGTPSPDRSLTIANAAGANYMNVKDGTREILMGVDGTGGILSVMSNHDLSFRTGANNEKMRITAAGNVGIGTATPGALLEIKGGDLLIKAAAEDPGDIIFQTASGTQKGRIWTNPNLNVRELHFSSGDNTPDVTIDANGSVGIGTLTPGFKLDIADRIRLRQGASGTAGIWMYQTGPNADRAFIGMVNDTEVGFWGNTGAAWGLTMDTTTGTAKLLASSNPIYFTKGWSGFPDPVTNASEISNDTGTYKALMIVGNRSAGGVRSVKLWDYLQVNGNLEVTGNIGTHGFSATPKTPGWGGGVHTWDVEAEGTIWARNGSQSGPRDLAENYYSDLTLQPGDVVCLDRKEDRIVRSERANDDLIIGVISTIPGFLLGAEHGDDEKRHDGKRAYPVALSGCVPCKVTDENGPIHRGDLLTSSSTLGHAMKAIPIVVGGVEIYAPGTIIGKALESLHSETAVIEVFVTLR